MSGAKSVALQELAVVAGGLASGPRLELLAVLIHGERSVEEAADATGLRLANASQHLQRLWRAGLLGRRKVGARVLYDLSDPQIVRLVEVLREVAERNRAELGRVVRTYYRNRDQLEPMTGNELAVRVREGSVVVLDVRDACEYAAGHVPGAVNIPIAELDRRLGELPEGEQVVAYCRGLYCLYSYDAVEVMRSSGVSARRLEGGFGDWLSSGRPVERAG